MQLKKEMGFVPELNFEGGENIEIVEEFKVVGYIIWNNMKTPSNTAYLAAKADKGIWPIKRQNFVFSLNFFLNL